MVNIQGIQQERSLDDWIKRKVIEVFFAPGILTCKCREYTDIEGSNNIATYCSWMETVEFPGARSIIVPHKHHCIHIPVLVGTVAQT